MTRLTLAIVAMSILSACSGASDGPLGVAPAAIAGDPGAYFGSRVTVSGPVGNVFSSHAFTLGGPEFDGTLLVVSVDSIDVATGRDGDRPIRRGDVVQVTGLVQRFDDLSSNQDAAIDAASLPQRFSGQPVVVARASGARMGHIVVTPRGGEDITPGSRSLITDLDAATGNGARDTIGRPARFQDVRLVAVSMERAFWAITASDTLLAAFVNGTPEPATSTLTDSLARWVIIGILREVPPQAELTTAWDLDTGLASQVAPRETYLEVIHATSATDPLAD